MRRCLTLALVVLAARSPLLRAQRPVDRAKLDRILWAEDARGTGVDGITPMVDGVRDADAVIRKFAVRGLGRLQRPELVATIQPLLDDKDGFVRAEAANALAQSLNRVPRRGSDSTQRSVPGVQAALVGALRHERDTAAFNAVADAIGRLPYNDTATAHAGERAIVDAAGNPMEYGAARGLYWLVINRNVDGPLSTKAVEDLRRAAMSNPDTLTRRVAMLALGTAKLLDSETVARGVRDRDDQVRRLALAGVGSLTPSIRASVAKPSLADASVVTRIAAISAQRAVANPPDCAGIIAASHDKDAYVALVAIDSLSLVCADKAQAMDALRAIVGTREPDGPLDHRWQRGAHALVALAQLDSTAAAPQIASLSKSANPDERRLAADAAAKVGDIAAMRRLAVDPDHNVAEAAIDGLSRRVKHGADSLYVAALASDGNQTVRAAATALAGSTTPAALPALFQSLARMTARQRENTKDPRVAVLQRIGEMGTAADSAKLQPYLADYDTIVARLAARSLTKWTGHPWQATPHPFSLPHDSLAAIALGAPITLHVVMAQSSGGGSFDVRLFGAEAPATVARIVHLADAGFYNGHLFQRVEPNFVVQGGGGDASEYVGDSLFLRDELTLRSHLRGTIGISSRGRDTGDAQWFINLTDNTRLDHEYTIVGEIVHGLAVAEQILEGDKIARVFVVRGKGVDVK